MGTSSQACKIGHARFQLQLLSSHDRTIVKAERASVLARSSHHLGAQRSQAMNGNRQGGRRGSPRARIQACQARGSRERLVPFSRLCLFRHTYCGLVVVQDVVVQAADERVSGFLFGFHQRLETIGRLPVTASMARVLFLTLLAVPRVVLFLPNPAVSYQH